MDSNSETSATSPHGESGLVMSNGVTTSGVVESADTVSEYAEESSVSIAGHDDISGGILEESSLPTAASDIDRDNGEGSLNKVTPDSATEGHAVSTVNSSRSSAKQSENLKDEICYLSRSLSEISRRLQLTNELATTETAARHHHDHSSIAGVLTGCSVSSMLEQEPALCSVESDGDNDSPSPRVGIALQLCYNACLKLSSVMSKNETDIIAMLSKSPVTMTCAENVTSNGSDAAEAEQVNSSTVTSTLESQVVCTESALENNGSSRNNTKPSSSDEAMEIFHQPKPVALEAIFGSGSMVDYIPQGIVLF